LLLLQLPLSVDESRQPLFVEQAVHALYTMQIRRTKEGGEGETLRLGLVKACTELGIAEQG